MLGRVSSGDGFARGWAWPPSVHLPRFGGLVVSAGLVLDSDMCCPRMLGRLLADGCRSALWNSRGTMPATAVRNKADLSAVGG